MRFYTLDWWMGAQDGDPEELFAAYDAHLREIETSVPRELVTLIRRGPLHDGKVRSLRLDAELRTLELELTAYEVTGEHVHIVLCYRGVRSVTSSADPEIGLIGPYGYGDLGYTEIHLVDGKPEHWLLFSSGIEIRISFESFDERTTIIGKAPGAG